MALADSVSDYTPYGGLIKAGTGAIRRITGMGDYRTESNSLIAKWTSNGPPEVVNAVLNHDGGGVILRHREYLGDISSGTGTPTAFTLAAYSLNPGLAPSFPWLSQIAANFEQYRWRGLIYEYKTLSVDAIAASTINIGSVVMATDYNVLHPPFQSKVQMENYEFCSSAKPSVNILHPVECASKETPVDKLYVRTSGNVSGDLRLYDLGLFQIASQGLPAPANSIGELWVSYEVELFKPNLYTLSSGDPGTSTLNTRIARFYNVYAAGSWTGVTGSQPGTFGYGSPSSNSAPTGAPGCPQIDLVTGAGSNVFASAANYFTCVSGVAGVQSNGCRWTSTINPNAPATSILPNSVAMMTSGSASSPGSFDTIVIGSDTLASHIWMIDIYYYNSTTAAWTLPALTVYSGPPNQNGSIASSFVSAGSYASGEIQAPANGTSSTGVWNRWFVNVPAYTSSANVAYFLMNHATGTWSSGTNAAVECMVTMIY